MTPQNDHNSLQESSHLEKALGLDETLQAAQAIDTSRPPTEHLASDSPNHHREPSENNSALNSIANLIKDYPGPSVLFGAGLAWLLVSREQNRNRSLPVRLRHRALETKEQLLEAKDTTLERLAEAKDHTLDRLSEAKEYTTEHANLAAQQASQKYESAKVSAEHGAEVVRNAYHSTLEENPLVLGACAIAAGLALGLLLPQTRKENELMGEARDGLLDQARGIVDEARKAAVRTLHMGSDSVKEHLIEAVQDAKETAMHSLDEAQHAAIEEAKGHNVAPPIEHDMTIPRTSPPAP